MTLAVCKDIVLDLNNGVLNILLNRPRKRNAMSRNMVDEIMAVFSSIADDRKIRVVVLKGAEGHFCAGGDISSMNRAASSTVSSTKETGDDVVDEGISAQTVDQTIWEFNRIFGRMISQVNRAPQLVVTLLEGAVLGGGFGLACVSDIAISDKEAQFAMPETGLGVIPAQIAPFVVARIGVTQTRRLALLGERIDGEQACQIGVAHYVTGSPEEMQEKLEQVVKKVKRCAPEANAATKKLILDVSDLVTEKLLDRAADEFVEAMGGKEGIEGTTAFLQKRLPYWAEQ